MFSYVLDTTEYHYMRNSWLPFYTSFHGRTFVSYSMWAFHRWRKWFSCIYFATIQLDQRSTLTHLIDLMVEGSLELSNSLKSAWVLKTSKNSTKSRNRNISGYSLIEIDLALNTNYRADCDWFQQLNHQFFWWMVILEILFDLWTQWYLSNSDEIHQSRRTG